MVITSLSDMRHDRLRRHLPDVYNVCFSSSGAKLLQDSSAIGKNSIKLVSVVEMSAFHNLLIYNYKDAKNLISTTFQRLSYTEFA